MQATGSVPWLVGAQASVLGRCCGGGGVPYPSSSSSSSSALCGRFQGVGVVRCCAQEKKPRVRKTKEERREMVESFVNDYRISNDGKFPSVNLTHKEVGGSYYIVREIVRDIIQENRVLGPGGLNAKALSFEDCPDSSELSIGHELDQSNIEILNMSDENQNGKGPLLEMSDKEGVFSLQKNVISTQQLLGSNLLEAGILNSVVQNGNVGDATSLETNLKKQDEAPCGKSREIENNSSAKQAPSFAHVSDLHKVTELGSFGGAHEETTSSSTDEVALSSKPSAVFQTNVALLQEQVMLTNDCHDDVTNNAVDEASLSSETNGILQTNRTLLQEHEILPESIRADDFQITDGEFESTTSDNQMDSYNSNTTPETVDLAKSIELPVHRAHDEVEQPLLHASLSEQYKSEGLDSQPALDTKGLLQTEDKHSAVEEDESEFKKSMFGITKEEHEASNAKHEDGISTTTTISRRTGKAQQKKVDNLFWLIIRAFVVAMSKFWKK